MYNIQIKLCLNKTVYIPQECVCAHAMTVKGLTKTSRDMKRLSDP